MRQCSGLPCTCIHPHRYPGPVHNSHSDSVGSHKGSLPHCTPFHPPPEFQRMRPPRRTQIHCMLKDLRPHPVCTQFPPPPPEIRILPRESTWQPHTRYRILPQGNRSPAPGAVPRRFPLCNWVVRKDSPDCLCNPRWFHNSLLAHLPLLQRILRPGTRHHSLPGKGSPLPRTHSLRLPLRQHQQEY